MIQILFNIMIIIIITYCFSIIYSTKDTGITSNIFIASIGRIYFI